MRKSALAVVSHIGPAPRGDKISAPHALAALAALGQSTRLQIFRLLMRKEPEASSHARVWSKERGTAARSSTAPMSMECAHSLPSW